MKKQLMKLMLVALVLAPASLFADTWKGVPMIDTKCQARFEGKPDTHTVGCALQCATGGYGIIVDKAFLKLDEHGNALAIEALKATTKKDAIRVTIDGRLEKGIVHVSKLAID